MTYEVVAWGHPTYPVVMGEFDSVPEWLYLEFPFIRITWLSGMTPERVKMMRVHEGTEALN